MRISIIVVCLTLNQEAEGQYLYPQPQEDYKMAKCLVDKYSKEELEQMAQDSISMRELCRKIGYESSGNNHKTVQSRLDKYNISTEHFTGVGKNAVKRNINNVFVENSTATQATLRRWYFKGEYTLYICAICGQEPFWNGKPLTLTLDHINGDNHDNRLENLRWVCPNCDRQLPTFAGKNVETRYNQRAQKNYCIDCGKEISKDAQRCEECNHLSARVTKRPSKEELYNILVKEKGNFSKIGRMYNVSDNAVRKWCKGYNLPFHSSDYK